MEPGSRRIGPKVDHLRETEIDGDIAVYDSLTARVHVLNRTASDTWLLSDGEHTAEQIVTLLAGAYQTTAEAIRSTVEHTIDVFETAGLLRTDDALR